jgi:hypothetical protein
MNLEIAVVALTQGCKRARLRPSPPEQLTSAEQLTEIPAALWDSL